MISAGKFIEAVVLGARWIFVIFIAGLIVALLLFALSFVEQLVHFGLSLHGMAESAVVLTMLNLIDMVLVAGLVVMVMISSFENYVNRLEATGMDIAWLGKLDVGSLKIKVTTSIVAIASIRLLEAFLNIESYSDHQLLWLVVIQLIFVVSALMLAIIDKIAGKHE